MARTSVPSKYSWLGMNYYHEPQGEISRTNVQIEADLDKIQSLTNKIKLYYHPEDNDTSIIVNICTRAKARGMYVVWTENWNDTDLDDTTWTSTYTPAVLANATAAEQAGADEFLIGNELTLHINAGATMMAATNNYAAYIAAMKTLATAVKANFTKIVGIEEVWGQDFRWANNDGLGSVDKIYFTLYETEAQFKTSLTNILTYENLGTPAIGEFSTTDTMNGVAGVDEDKWATLIANRCEIIDDSECQEAYVFTFRDTGTGNNGRGYGFFNTLSEDTYHTAWQSLFGGRRWITSVNRTSAGARTATTARSVNPPVLASPTNLKTYISSLSGLVAYWPLNEVSGTTADNLQGTAALDGTIDGATLGADGQIGTSFTFDGSNDAVTMGSGNALNITGNAISCLFLFNFLTNSAGDFKILGNNSAGGHGYMISSNAIPALRVEMSTAGGAVDYSENTTIVANTWYLACMTYDGSIVKLYSNGSQLGAGLAATGNIISSATQFKLGEAPWADGLNYAGALQHVAILNRALTPAEILRIAQLAGLA